MANLKIRHRFVISKGHGPQAAYLVMWAHDIPAVLTLPAEHLVDYRALTTLSAAKREACAAVDRHRLTWRGPVVDDDLTTWSAEYIEVRRLHE